jgi:flagellar assembly protein FliH
MIMSKDFASAFSALRPTRSGFCPGYPGSFAARNMPEPHHAEAPDDRYAQGFSDGYAAGLTRRAEDDRAVEQLEKALRAIRPEPADDLGILIAETVQRLVRQVVADCPISPDEVLQRAQRAAALIAKEDAATVLHLHPEDAKLLPAEIAGLTIVPQFDLARGDIVIPCAAGTIEDRISQKLAALEAALGLGEGA